MKEPDPTKKAKHKARTNTRIQEAITATVALELPRALETHMNKFRTEIKQAEAKIGTG